MTNREIAIRSKALIADPERWTKWMLAADKDGDRVWDTRSPEACQWCVQGAAMHVLGIKDILEARIDERYMEYVKELERIVWHEFDNYGVGNFNDDRNTRHDHIIKLLDIVIEESD